MEMTEKKNDLKSMMVESMEKVKEMVDANNIVGEPITTPDGVTLIPISRLSYGFGCGGGDYGKNKENSGAGCGAGVRVEPMAFLVVKGGVTRMLPVGAPAITTVDRVIEMVPELLDRVEGFVDKYVPPPSLSVLRCCSFIEHSSKYYILLHIVYHVI